MYMIVKIWRHSQNLKYIAYRNAVRGGPSHGHSEHAQKLVMFSSVVFELCKWTDRQTDKQTNKQTGILITILHTPPKGVVKCLQKGLKKLPETVITNTVNCDRLQKELRLFLEIFEFRICLIFSSLRRLGPLEQKLWNRSFGSSGGTTPDPMHWLEVLRSAHAMTVLTYPLK